MIVVGLILCIVLASLAINVYTVNSTKGDVHTISQIEASGIREDAILVLGASVYADGRPSDMLADRLETACDLYFSGVASRIIVSGDNRSSHYDESDAMKSYCMSAGVPANDITVDPAGIDTYASVYRAKNLYGAESLIIVTQAYHLYRAMMIANLLGCKDVEGVPADKGDYKNQWKYSIREVLARDKDFVQAVLKLEPGTLEVE